MRTRMPSELLLRRVQTLFPCKVQVDPLSQLSQLVYLIPPVKNTTTNPVQIGNSRSLTRSKWVKKQVHIPPRAGCSKRQSTYNQVLRTLSKRRTNIRDSRSSRPLPMRRLWLISRSNKASLSFEMRRLLLQAILVGRP